MSNVFIDVWEIEHKPLDPQLALAFVNAPANGAGTLFLGAVRDFNLGKKVVGVSYDVFDPLAKQSFKEIANEAQEKWGNELRLYIIHGKGRLDIGGLSVVIAAGSPHRDEAFQACRYIIEQIKHRSPVWKQEHYIDGDSEWVQGHALCAHAHHHQN